MKTKDKLLIFLIVATITIWFTYLVRSVLPPFIFALIVAYFLDPLVDICHDKYKMSRVGATSLILGLFLAVLIAISSFIFPIIYTQFIAFVGDIPKYYRGITVEFYPKVSAFLNKLGFQLEQDFQTLSQNKEVTAQFLNLSKGVLDNALNSWLSLVNIFSLIFISPILIFYLLKDWDIFIKKINSYLPKKKSLFIREIAKDIDKTMSGYVRGQFNVCLILGIIYSTLLSFTSLNYGFLIGLLTGLFSFIPYVGMILGVACAIVIALFQWGFDPSYIAIIAAIFIFGQIIESNFLTPKLLGKKIGLHPVWLIFGLFVFGSLFGAIGLLLAVPLTAICGVIIKHFALLYKKKFT